MLALFGATQGLLTHMRLNGLKFGAKTLMPSPFAKATLPLFVLGGAAAGGVAGMYFFGDAQFRRLRESHMQDRSAQT